MLNLLTRGGGVCSAISDVLTPSVVFFVEGGVLISLLPNAFLRLSIWQKMLHHEHIIYELHIASNLSPVVNDPNCLLE